MRTAANAAVQQERIARGELRGEERRVEVLDRVTITREGARQLRGYQDGWIVEFRTNLPRQGFERGERGEVRGVQDGRVTLAMTDGTTRLFISAKIEQAREAGATFIVIDTPPHADAAASKAMEAADLVLIPCRPSAFDLSAVRTTARLVQLLAKPAFVVFTAGPPRADRLHSDAGKLVEAYGIPACPHRTADRAVFRHASALGKTVFEMEAGAKAIGEIEQVHMWACE